MKVIRSWVTLNTICSKGARARDLGVSDWTIQNVVKKKLSDWSLAKNQKFLLTDLLKTSRLKRC